MLLSTHTIAQMLKARCKFSVPAMSLAKTVFIARPATHIFVTAASCFGTIAAPQREMRAKTGNALYSGPIEPTVETRLR